MNLVEIISNISDIWTGNGRTDGLWGANFPVASVGWAFPMMGGQPNVAITKVSIVLWDRRDAI